MPLLGFRNSPEPDREPDNATDYQPRRLAESVESSTPLEAHDVDWFQRTFAAIANNIETAVLGKRHQVELTLTCLVSGGHLLVEDFPGTGKTVLARALANTIDFSHSRIQFTPDMLPSDVTGVTVYDQHKGTFDFHQGPVFKHLVLADEINRASPKTQAALLEVMEEGMVTVDGVRHAVPTPFMVIATQNPIEQAGTYRLPEAQLDRFLMKCSMGYPGAEAMDDLLLNAGVRDRAGLLRPVVDASDIQRLSALADRVHVSRGVVTYVREIAEASRTWPQVKLGVSARGCLSFLRVAKSWALAHGRGYVTPEDVRVLAEPVLCHRVLLGNEALFEGVSIDDVLAGILSSVTPPQGDR